jgi:hypothetical protein
MDIKSKLSVKIVFDYENKKLLFIDVLGESGGYNTIGVDPLKVKGLIKVSTESRGIVYSNPGFDLNDYSSPDIDGAGTGTNWMYIMDALLDQNGSVLKDVYSIQYKIATTDTPTTDFSFFRYYPLTYEPPKLFIEVEKDVQNHKFTVRDISDYSLNDGSILPSPPITGSRDLRVAWPEDSGVEDSYTNQSELIVENLVPGVYKITLNVSPSYQLYYNGDNGILDVGLIDKLRRSGDSVGYQIECYNTSIIECYNTLYKQYNEAKTNNIPKAQQLWQSISEISVLYTSYLMAQSIGEDTTSIIERLKVVFATYGCELKPLPISGFGMCLGSGDYFTGELTPDEKKKLDSIEWGAEVNVQADWNQTNPAEDSFIQNKPVIIPGIGLVGEIINMYDITEEGIYYGTNVAHSPFGIDKISVFAWRNNEDDFVYNVASYTNFNYAIGIKLASGTISWVVGGITPYSIYTNTNPDDIGIPDTNKTFVGTYNNKLWIKDDQGNVTFIGDGGGDVGVVRYDFITTEGQTVFTLNESASPYLVAYVNGVVVDPSYYTLNGNDVEFSSSFERYDRVTIINKI